MPASRTTLYEQVMSETPGGEALISCLQCGTCGGSCPSGADMDSTPRRLFALLEAGFDQDVLESNAPWHCVTCYYCMVRCPQEIPITDLMYTLKQKAIEHGKFSEESHADWSDSFIGFVEHYGRSFEFGLATRYHLRYHPIRAIRQSGLGFKMLREGRLSPTPDHVQNMDQLTAILNEAKRIAEEETVG